MEPERVSTFEEAEKNARLFSNVGNNTDSLAFKSLGKYFHWYYFPRINVLAPK